MNKQTNERTKEQTKEHKIFGISTTERNEVTYLHTIYEQTLIDGNQVGTYVGMYQTKEGTNERAQDIGIGSYLFTYVHTKGQTDEKNLYSEYEYISTLKYS